jgi:ectoine hydroxylase-related dioxygenase (phytanoyl-CoA dioxygenase family)
MCFNNNELNNQFERDGFVVFDFISKTKVGELTDLFHTSTIKEIDGFYSSSFIKDDKERAALNKRIYEIIKPEIDFYCQEHQSLGACFLSKNCGEKGLMPPHQDWTIVNEPDVNAVTIWIPLIDVDHQNGALQVIPGSHKFSNSLRSPSLENPFKNVEKEIQNDLITIPLKAGQAIAFSHGLIHASKPNFSKNVRVATTYGFVPKNQTLFFYHQEANGDLEKYQVDPDFFEKYNRQIGEKPSWLSPIQVLKYQQHFETQASYTKSKLQYKLKRAMQTYKMIPILKDERQQLFFEENGYLILPVLDAREISDLRQYYFDSPIGKEQREGFHVSMDHEDKNFCRETRDFIWKNTLPKMSEYLTDFKPFVASYTAKDPSPLGIVPPHQDWSFTDKESDGYCSITCWIALQDTTIENGALGVIPGSHKLMQNHRPSPSPQAPVPLAKHMFSIFPYTKLIEMKAGEMLMFDNRTFHASPPNVTNATRLAVGVGITQSSAELVHYYLKPDGEKQTLIKYSVDEDFFLNYDNARLSRLYNEGKLIEGYGNGDITPYHFDDWDTETLLNIIQNSGVSENENLKAQMEKLFPQQYETVKQSEDHYEEIQFQQDNRTFLEKYTLLNIYSEIKSKLGLK